MELFGDLSFCYTSTFQKFIHWYLSVYIFIYLFGLISITISATLTSNTDQNISDILQHPPSADQSKKEKVIYNVSFKLAKLSSLMLMNKPFYQVQK